MLGKRKYPFTGEEHSGGKTKYISRKIEDLFQAVINKIPSTALQKFPPLVFIHQLYDLGESRTWVDQQIGILRNEGKLTAFKLRVECDERSIVLAKRLDVALFISKVSSSRIVNQFVDEVLPSIHDISIEKEHFKRKFKASESTLRVLVQEGVLVMRDIGRFWLSFPGAGQFVKTYTLGRRHLIKCIRKAKFSQILETELFKKKLPKQAVLGMEYHILDLLGSDNVKCIKTTSGNVLRIIFE